MRNSLLIHLSAVILGIWYTLSTVQNVLYCTWGGATRRLQDCLRDNIYDTIKKYDTSIARHFNNCYGENTMAIHLQAIEKVVTPRRGVI